MLVICSTIEYGRSSSTPVDKGHSPSGNLRIYQQIFNIPKTLVDTISAAQTFYQQKAQQPEGQQQLPAGAGQQTGAGDMSSKEAGYSGQQQEQPSSIHPTPGQQSIQDRTQDASSGDWRFGG